MSCWKATNPDETASELAQALEPHVVHIVSSGDGIYTSTSFNPKDTDSAALDKNKELLATLRHVDPRGNHFSQEDMRQALHIGIQAKALQADLARSAEVLGITAEELKAVLAMKIRVMCSHDRVRNPADSACVVGGFSDSSNKQRVHPFVYFRKDESEEEEALLISREFIGTQAVEHYSDGSMVEAGQYQAGPAGMVIASWDCGASLELEVPNSRLQDGRIVMTPPPAAPLKRAAATFKRPAGSAASLTKQERAFQEEQEEPEEEEEDVELQEDPEFKIHMSVKPGHDESMCLFLQTSFDDKAQILQVSTSMVANCTLTPKEAVETCMAYLRPTLASLPRMRVKQLPREMLQEMRSAAQRCRDSLFA